MKSQSDKKTTVETEPVAKVEANQNNEHDGRKLNELENLYVFMNNYRAETKKKSGKNLPCTHTMMSEPYGKYNIPEDAYNTFKKFYRDAIIAGYKLSIVERHKDYGPIVIDLDFVQAGEHDRRYYTETTIANIVRFYNRVIKKYLKVKNTDLHAYVMEKKKPTMKKGEYHDGLHIVYPYICTKPNLQMLIRKDVIKLVEKHNIFKCIPLINSLDNVFDQAVIYFAGWLMYGSRKSRSSYPYYVTHIYHPIGKKIFDTIIPGEDVNTKESIHHFVNVLSCRRFFSENQVTEFVEGTDLVEIENKVNDLKKNIAEGPNKQAEIAALMGEDTNFIKAVSEELLVEAKNLVKLFSKDRAHDYYSWYQVGKCLYNIDYRLLDDWIAFSKKSSKFVQGECEILWKKMRQSNYTMATLHYFASKDNPKMYLKLKEEKLNKLIDNGIEASHHTIAKLLMEKFKFTFKCASIKHNLWYEFKNHRWVEIDSAYSLRNLISEDLVKDYIRKQAYMYEKANQCDQGRDKDKCINEAASISKLIKKLNDSSFKNGVIRECADIAYDPKFLKNLDENIYLICFENGVYDLEADCFRAGCPDDYLSLCTNYPYIEYNEDDEIVTEINEFLEKIQPDKVMRHYLMTLLSTCLAGSISEESFYVFTGSGANGKSKLMELMKYAMGDLFKPMDILVLIGKRTSSSSATPELADKKGIRLCPFDEPKATDEINTGFMKIFTGGDVITARALFKEPIYFKPQFKPFLLCNNLPNIKSDDDGTWRRLKVIPFLSKFIRQCDITKSIRKNGLGAGQFWANGNLSEKLPDWKQTFMGMLIKYYRKYRANGLIHPKLVTKHTAEYRKRCDVFQDFLGDFLEKTDNAKNTISMINLHDGMRAWYKSNYDGKCPNTKELRNYMKHRIPTYHEASDSLTHYKIKSDDAENVVDDLDNLG